VAVDILGRCPAPGAFGDRRRGLGHDGDDARGDGELSGTEPGTGRHEVVDVHDGESWMAGESQVDPVIPANAHHELRGRTGFSPTVTSTDGPIKVGQCGLSRRTDDAWAEAAIVTTIAFAISR
jgi:hypothetical protein